jgi:hypothetical protein
VQNDFLSVWVDHDVQNLSLDYLLGTMELDGRGVRIEHDVPYRTFLTQLPNTAPCEEPDACGFLQCEEASLMPTGSSNSTGDSSEELPRPSPNPRPVEGPALQQPESQQVPGAILIPPPAPPNLQPVQQPEGIPADQ